MFRLSESRHPRGVIADKNKGVARREGTKKAERGCILVFASPIKQTFANNVKREEIKARTPEKRRLSGKL